MDSFWYGIMSAIADYQQLLNKAESPDQRLSIMVTASMDIALDWDEYGELCEYEASMGNSFNDPVMIGDYG